MTQKLPMGIEVMNWRAIALGSIKLEMSLGWILIFNQFFFEVFFLSIIRDFFGAGLL